MILSRYEVSEATYRSEASREEPPPSYNYATSMPKAQSKNYPAAHANATPGLRQHNAGPPPSSCERAPIEPSLDAFRCIPIQAAEPTSSTSRSYHSAARYGMPDPRGHLGTGIGREAIGRPSEPIPLAALLAYANQCKLCRRCELRSCWSHQVTLPYETVH